MGEREQSRAAQEAGEPVAHAAILSYVRQPEDERPSLYPPLRALAQEAGLSKTQVYKEIDAATRAAREEQSRAAQEAREVRMPGQDAGQERLLHTRQQLHSWTAGPTATSLTRACSPAAALRP